ncbi:MAG TPA: hypothetical protein VLG13_02985 [Patescibacteria group bacterium]|nr:hypothetical protein [Patescibacteria group bacterium]
MTQSDSEAAPREPARSFETAMASEEMATCVHGLRAAYRELRIGQRDELAYEVEKSIEFFVGELTARGDLELINPVSSSEPKGVKALPLH